MSIIQFKGWHQNLNNAPAFINTRYVTVVRGVNGVGSLSNAAQHPAGYGVEVNTVGGWTGTIYFQEKQAADLKIAEIVKSMTREGRREDT